MGNENLKEADLALKLLLGGQLVSWLSLLGPYIWTKIQTLVFGKYSFAYYTPRTRFLFFMTQPVEYGFCTV